ncbi:MAG: type VI secretion system accessory protein TagJ [Gemmataceae bacterium]
MSTSARDELAAGHLQGALAHQLQVLENRPTAAEQLFAVELLILDGQPLAAWKLLKQIESPDSEVQWRAERRRWNLLLRAIHRRERNGKPIFMIEHTPKHLRWREKAWRELKAGNLADAWECIDRSDRLAPPLNGFINGIEFELLRDADDLIGSLLEVLHEELLMWFPWEAVRSLQLDEAKNPLDVAYRPGRLDLTDGMTIQVMVPLIYAGAQTDGEKLAIDHDVHNPGDGPTRGRGARRLMVGDDEVDFTAVRQIEIRHRR